MRKIYKTFISPFILILLFTSLLSAGNGKIAGVIKNNLSEPVSAVSVLLAGSKQTSLTDDEGRYFILNISPGKYDVIINAIGFIKKTVRSVEVRSDLTTELNVQLEKRNNRLEEIVVDVERNLLNKTMTSSKTIYSADEIASTFSTSSTFEILQTAPGMYKGFLRGGLQNMTKTIVDGVDISDEYYAMAVEKTLDYFRPPYRNTVRFRESGQAVLMNVDPNSISEISVITGAVNSDYFSASSGIINYSLKEGSGTLKGKISYKRGAQKLGIAGPDIYNDKDKYFSEKEYLFSLKTSSDSVRAKRYTWTEGLYELGQIPTEVDFSLSGGIFENLGFFFTANYKKNPDCRLPNQRYKEVNSQLKLNYNLNSDMKFSVLGMLFDKGKLFGWKNSDYQESWRYYLQGVPQNDGLSWVGSAKFTHTLSDKLFYEVQISNKNSNTRIGYVDGNNDGKLQLNEEGDFLTFSDDQRKKYVGYSTLFPFNYGSYDYYSAQWFGAGNTAIYLMWPNYYYENFKNNIFTAKFDLTNQISKNQELKTGFSYISHNLDMNRHSVNTGYSYYPYEKWNFKPIEFGAYFQDKIEYAGLIANLGLRYDLWDIKAAGLKNIYNPFSIIQIKSSDGLYYNTLNIDRGENIEPSMYLSPSISLSHPIYDKAVIYYSYSSRVQPPAFSMLYTNFYDLFNLMNAEILSIDREPYKTTNYEIGAQWQISDKFALNLNAYDTYIRNYLNSSFSVKTIKGAPPIYYLYSSTGYARSNGIEFSVEGIKTEVTDFLKISGRLSYTYSHVKVPKTLFNLTSSDITSFSTSDTLARAYQLPFEDIQNYSRFETEVTGGSSTLSEGYNRKHRFNCIFSMDFPYDISLVGIGTLLSGFYYIKRYVDPRYPEMYLGESPWTKRLDLHIEKSIKISGFRLSAFVDIKNLFDAKNIVAYDNSSTGYDLFQTNNDPTGTQKRPIGQDGSLFYDIPREIYFGASFEF